MAVVVWLQYTQGSCRLCEIKETESDGRSAAAASGRLLNNATKAANVKGGC